MSTFTPGPGTKYLLYSGGTVPTGSANGVLYLDANKVITSGTALAFNGTTFSAPAVQVDNVNINGNTVSATNTNGDLLLAANGTGQVDEVISSVNYALASQFDVGTEPNDIPLNQYLGTMAFQSAEAVSVGFIRSNAVTGSGYALGAGGAITQATGRTTGVTVDAACGAITLVSAAGSTSPSSFTVTNSSVVETDVIILSQRSGTDKYVLLVTAVGAGSFEITAYTTGGTTTEQPVINFAVIKAVAA
jgi:hypothetical protein